MGRNGRRVALTVALLAGPLTGCSASPAAEPPADSDRRLDGMLERMERGEAVDFLELRRAWSESERAAGVDGGWIEARAEATRGAMLAKEHALVERLAGDILERSPLYPAAHQALAVAARELGRADRAEHHARIARGLLDSICGRLDGRDPSRPCWVVAGYEADFYVGQHGLVLESLSPGRCGGRLCDVLTVVDPETDERFDLHFVPARPVGRRNDQLEY